MSNIQAEFELHPEGSLPVSRTAGQTATPPSDPYPATNPTAAEQVLPCSMLPKKVPPAQRIVLSLAFDGKQIRIPGQNAKSIQAQFFQDDSGRNFLLPISPGGSFKEIRDEPSLSILLQTQMHLSAICILNDADCDRNLLAGPDAAPAAQDRAIPFSSGW